MNMLRTRIGLAGVSLLLPLSSAATAHHPQPSAVPAIPAASADVAEKNTPTATVTAFHAALKRGDTTAAMSFLAEDVMIFESGGVERNRAEYAAHHLVADAEFSAAVQRTLLDRRVVEVGDLAWVTTIETVTGTFRNQPINSRSLETMALQRVDDHWRITHIHWSSAKLTSK